MNVKLVLVFCFAGLLPVQARTPQPQDQSMIPDHHEAQEGVNRRGDEVMGFSHQKTTHHFRLYPDGGAIEVEANDARDTVSRDLIRLHLTHVARMFAAGDFNAPMLIHDRVPPGVSTLKRLRPSVTYEFEPTDQGGCVRITTHNVQALQAVHEFLRFQITEHETGDSLQVSPPAGKPLH